MTLEQLNNLTEEELLMALYIINILKPIKFLIGEINPRGLTWIKHNLLIKKLLDCFPMILPEYHPIYASLMDKLGVKVEINPVQPPSPIS